MKDKTKGKGHQVGDVSGGESKVQCYKEQYCIGTWNVRAMNQGKWEMVKQARVNINILGISERKWTGIGKFNSNDLYIYYCGQESLRRNEVALKVSKRVWNAVLWVQFKNHTMISDSFQGKPFNITVIQESWALQKLCFWTVVLEKTLESPLDCKIKPVNPKGHQPWIFIGRTDAEAEAPIH